jgi:hypothetical protein
VLGSAAEVAGVILSKAPIAVMLVTLHLEIMTQAHYVECVKDDGDIDPFFSKLLRFHWLEESQHARIDALELDKLLDAAPKDQIGKSFDDYMGLIDAFDGLLKAQSEMDARALARATGTTFNPDQVAQITRAQHQGYRHTFLVYGMTNPTFLETVAKIDAHAASRISHRAQELS